MNTKVSILLLALLLTISPLQLPAQSLTVATGTVTKLQSGAYLQCTNANLKVEGKLLTESSSMVTMAGTGGGVTRTIDGNGECQMHTLKIAGNVATAKDLSIDGDLIFQSGTLDIRNNNLYIKGQLVGETENSYLTATTGEVITTLPVVMGQNSNLLGLNATPRENIQVEVRRGHVPSQKGRDVSVSRYYNFAPPVDLGLLRFTYHSVEKNGVIEPQVCSYVNGEWVANVPQNNNPLECVGLDKTEKVTVFNEPETYIPKSFTPNGDGIGDYLEIVGVEKHHNNRLIIFSQKETTNVILDKSPYQNDFDGTANGTPLPEQTYFYIYYKDANNDKKPKKGYFELVR